VEIIKILAIESSAKPVSAAVCEDGKIIALSFQNSGLTHSRTLLPLIEDLLKNSDLSYDDISLVAVP
jgi:tRNA threonylcarbamoyladenosine biosynthesis protein TsaB